MLKQLFAALAATALTQGDRGGLFGATAPKCAIKAPDDIPDHVFVPKYVRRKQQTRATKRRGGRS